MSKKVADVIIEVLQSAGIKRCYGVVDDTLMGFWGYRVEKAGGLGIMKVNA